MKKEDKRIHNNDFEQVEECYICKKLFWAKSRYELGNWETECKFCQDKSEEEREKKNEFIKKNGTPRYGSNNQIFVWTLEKDAVFNLDYKPQSNEEEEIWASGFVNVDTFEEKFGNKK